MPSVASREESSQDSAIAFTSSPLPTVSEYELSSYLQKCGHVFAAGFGVAVAMFLLLVAISTVAIWQVKCLFGREEF